MPTGPSYFQTKPEKVKAELFTAHGFVPAVRLMRKDKPDQDPQVRCNLCLDPDYAPEPAPDFSGIADPAQREKAARNHARSQPNEANTHKGFRLHAHGWVDTKAGTLRVCPGDWIVTFGDGSCELVKPADFARRFDKSK